MVSPRVAHSSVVVDFREFQRAFSSERGTTGISRIQAIFQALFERISLTFGQSIGLDLIFSEGFSLFASLISETLRTLRYEDFIGKYIDLFSLRDIPELMKKEDKQFVWESRTVVEVQPVDFQGLTKAFDELNPKEAAHVLKYTDVDRVLYDEALSLFHGKKEKTTD